MRILFNTNNSYKNYQNKYNFSFGALKKSRVDGLDLNLVERFKPPMEKFNAKYELQKWFENKYNETLEKDYGGRSAEAKIQRKLLIKQWHEYITKENLLYTIPQQLFIITGITQDLKPGEDRLPPVLNGGALADTVEEIDKKVHNRPKILFNFLKIYNKKLNDIYTEENNDLNVSGMKWMIIPSQKHDPKNFENNVDKLKFYSSKNWCTKSSAAEPYLKKGDFHFLFVDGKIKLAIRFVGNLIQEIRDEHNRFEVPFELSDEVEKHIEKYKCRFSKKAKEAYTYSKKTADAYNKTKQAVKEALKSNDEIKIFAALGIKAKRDKDGFLTISHYDYKAHKTRYSVSDFGIDERKLLKNVRRITGDASFSNSTIKKLETIQYIGGYISLGGIEDLGCLEEVGGNLNASYSPVKSVGNLKRVGGDVDFSETKNLKSLGNLEYVGKRLKVNNSNIESLGKLKKINGTLVLCNSKVKDLGDIEEIWLFANLAYTELESLGKLKRVGEDLNIEHSKIKDIGEIEEIGGNTYCKEAQYLSQKDKDKLEEISHAVKKFGLRDFNKDYIMEQLDKNIIFFSTIFKLMSEKQLHESGIWDRAPEVEKKCYLQNKQ